MSDRNTEHRLTHADQTAIVSPFGASLRRYFITTNGKIWNAVWGYEGAANKRGGQGDVLIPFPGRIKNGVYTINGSRHELEKTDKDGPNAIHGFLRAELFETKKVSDREAVFTFALGHRHGYPFELAVEVAYALGDNGLQTHFKVTNTGREAAPVGAGFHPYFCADQGELADWNVMIPARTYIELKDLLPTGRVLDVKGTPLDFRQGRTIGETRYNDCVTNLEHDANGFTTAWLANADRSRKVSIRMDSSFEYVVVYTGDQIAPPGQRKAFAIEPMTCAPDAFNHADRGARRLKSGETLAGTYVIKAN